MCVHLLGFGAIEGDPFDELRCGVLKWHDEIDALMIVSMNFWLCRKAQREFDVMVHIAPVAAIGCHLIAPKVLGTLYGLSL